MDIYTGLIFGVIVILCAAVLASISLFGMKTKTYDEAKAEKKTVVETVKLAQHQKQKKNKKSLKKVKIKYKSKYYDEYFKLFYYYFRQKKIKKSSIRI